MDMQNTHSREKIANTHNSYEFPMSPGHVYLIDDNEEILSSLSRLLQFAGYSVRCWADARSFLAELPNEAPAVVVTDMQMPGMTGLQLHQALLEQGRQMPVIYLSGESSVPQAIEAMKLKAHDFLTKPFTRESLFSAISAALERDRLAMQSVIEKARFEEALRHLSPREREVHGLLIKGFSNNEIVNALEISLPTAKQYKSEVMRKLGVRSLSQLIEMSKTFLAGEYGQTPQDPKP